eukprot:jgi/Antlo1/1696/811
MRVKLPVSIFRQQSIKILIRVFYAIYYACILFTITQTYSILFVFVASAYTQAI